MNPYLQSKNYPFIKFRVKDQKTLHITFTINVQHVEQQDPEGICFILKEMAEEFKELEGNWAITSFFIDESFGDLRHDLYFEKTYSDDYVKSLEQEIMMLELER